MQMCVRMMGDICAEKSNPRRPPRPVCLGRNSHKSAAQENKTPDQKIKRDTVETGDKTCLSNTSSILFFFSSEMRAC